MIIVGTNHKYSSMEFREQFVFSDKNLKNGYDFLVTNCGFKGCVIINTCNRIEICASIHNELYGFNIIKKFLTQFFEINPQAIDSAFYFLSGKNAFIHLCNVICGLDSLLIGETQIAGQVKSAYMKSVNYNSSDKHLKKIFSKIFTINKIVRKSVFFSGCKVSVGSIAVNFLEKKIGSLYGKKILIIGVGKVTALVLKYLNRQAKNIIFIANRTYEKATELASLIDAEAVKFNELDNMLLNSDIVISATSSPHYIINRARVNKLIEKSGGKLKKKIFFMDLAVPRDIEPEIRLIQGIELVNLSDLEPVINLNSLKRKKKSVDAENLILKQVNLWENHIKSQQGEVI
ncbi:glutamyl-tRNA reductase [bacterium]|nr:glutamyl-tRNA reductase [bacterium]